MLEACFFRGLRNETKPFFFSKKRRYMRNVKRHIHVYERSSAGAVPSHIGEPAYVKKPIVTVWLEQYPVAFTTPDPSTLGEQSGYTPCCDTPPPLPVVVVGVLKLSSSCRRVVVELSSSCRRAAVELTFGHTQPVPRYTSPSPYTLAARAQQPRLLRPGRRQQGGGHSRRYGSSRSGPLQHGRQVLRGALYEEQHATGHRGDLRTKQGDWVQKSPQPVDSIKHERQFSVASIGARRGGHREQGLPLRGLRWGAGERLCDGDMSGFFRLCMVYHCALRHQALKCKFTYLSSRTEVYSLALFWRGGN